MSGIINNEQISCTFCDIISKKCPADILFETSDIIVFVDIKPVAQHHYLIVPKNHIKNAKCLTKENLPLLEKMISEAENILFSKGADLSTAL